MRYDITNSVLYVRIVYLVIIMIWIYIYIYTYHTFNLCLI